MKLENKHSDTELGGSLGEAQKFTIAASKEAFKILSAGLYNDRITAVIRELSTNAFDAHVAAGKKDVPFYLHIPTYFEPEFKVRDDGVGLAHEEVMGLYRTYFGTNRSDSNDFVGALGLGSKSPFSYTEGFTVSSRYQGVTRTYTAFIDENGTPNIVLQSEEETPDACNGLEVSFPVDTNDIWEFKNKAKSALQFFDPLPNRSEERRVGKE